MISLKKVYGDELLQLALFLSLLRVHSDSYLEDNLYGSVNDLDLNNGTSWRSYTPNILRSHYIHPKNLDSVLLNYEREVFADLNSLGRYNRENLLSRNVTAYLLNVDGAAALSEAPSDVAPPQQGTSSIDSLQVHNENAEGGLELSQEDMDLIEVLWKQDVDLGFTLELPEPKNDKPEKPESADNQEQSTTAVSAGFPEDDIEKLKALKEVNNDNLKPEAENATENLNDPWAGFNYTVDTETGEYVIKGELEDTLNAGDCDPTCDLPLGDLSLPLPEFLLEDLQLVDLEDDLPEESKVLEEILTQQERQRGAAPTSPSTPSSSSSSSTSAPEETGEGAAAAAANPAGGNNKELDSGDEDLDILADMIQTSQFHHPHHRAFQSRVPFVRTVSVDQHLTDLANLLSSGDPAGAMAARPFGHHHHHPNPLHHHPLQHYAGHAMGYVGAHHQEAAAAARGVLLHNATLAPPMGEINGTGVPSYGAPAPAAGTNLGSAVATSMNLTNSSEPMGEANRAPYYKVEPSHDMMYYHNNSSELNQTDGFLSSLLNDEDLQLMDMAMNEGMYTMRMLDSNNAVSNLNMNGTATTTMSRTEVERMDTSSDSAVSSMGSERVPSLSDGEWCDGGSDSGHTTAGEHYVSDYTKYRPYDYSYNSRQHSGTMGSSDSARLQPVAQKKHQMFGKRYFQEQGSASASVAPPQTPVKYEYRDPTATPAFTSPTHGEGAVGPKPLEMKYSCSMEFGRHHLSRGPVEHVQHNHTYHLPAENTGAMQRPLSRDKVKGRKTEEEHLTRDEKRARALNVPISVDDIINLPMDEFNERLSKYDLSEAQLSLIRDIRRRGKNKVAAQNCRKRKLDQILSLADEVKEMRDRKMRLLSEHEYMVNECQRIKDKYQQLYRHVFQNLRDPEGNHYSPYQYSLQTSADGSILIVPRANSNLTNPDKKDTTPPQGRKE